MRLSLRQYARHRGVSEAAVRKAIKTGRIQKEPDGTIDPIKADAAWQRNTNPAQQRKATKQPSAKPAKIQPPAPTTNTATTSYQTSRTVRETYAAKMAKLEYEEKAGKLVNADEVRVVAFNLGRRIRDRILTIPHRVASIIAAETNPQIIEQLLSKELRTSMEELTNDPLANHGKTH